MKRGVRGRLLMLFGAAVVSIVFFLPSTPWYGYMPDWWKAYFPDRGITLGLDLQGGMHLVLEVEGEKAVENRINRIVNSLNDHFKDKGISVDEVKRTGNS